MAYTKQYSKTTWVNNEAPAINATNLNKIEEGIDNVDTELVSQDSRISNLEANEVDATGIDAGYVPTADGQDGWSWEAQSGGGLTDGIKQALLQIAQKVAYIDEDGQDYYDDLYDALYAVTAISVTPTSVTLQTIGGTQQLTATTTPSGANVTWASSNTAVATVDSTGLVTSVAYGTCTITATAGSVSATCSVVVAQATCTGITATYTQSGTVYDSDTLDSLKTDLVVTASWSNGTTSTLADTDYTLSGTLATGTSTVTVSYGGQTATFTVTVTHQYSITNTLTNCTNSNSATAVNEETAYTGTLTADTDYVMGTVTITMGGTDITSTAYESGTGVISIASVTGDIIITAVATAPPITLNATYPITLTWNPNNNNYSTSKALGASGTQYRVEIDVDSVGDANTYIEMKAGTTWFTDATAWQAYAGQTGTLTATATLSSYTAGAEYISLNGKSTSGGSTTVVISDIRIYEV